MSAVAGLWTAHNLSLYAIPAGWVLAIAPHFYAAALYNKERAPGTGEWDNSFPRRNISNVKDGKLSPYMQDRYLRAEAAQQNAFENLPLFAAAVVSVICSRGFPAISKAQPQKGCLEMLDSARHRGLTADGDSLPATSPDSPPRRSTPFRRCTSCPESCTAICTLTEQRVSTALKQSASSSSIHGFRASIRHGPALTFTAALGNARTATFLVGIGSIFTMFIRAGNRLFTALPMSGY